MNEKEIELTKKNLENQKENLEKLERKLKITKAHKEFLNVKRKYEDSVRPFNRDQEDVELEMTVKGLKEQLENTNQTIKDTEDQLNVN